MVYAQSTSVIVPNATANVLCLRAQSHKDHRLPVTKTALSFSSCRRRSFDLVVYQAPQSPHVSSCRTVTKCRVCRSPVCAQRVSAMRGALCASGTPWKLRPTTNRSVIRPYGSIHNWKARSCVCFESPDRDRGAVPDEYQTWPATAPPPRRLLVGGLAGLTIVLGGNFGGATSALLGMRRVLTFCVACGDIDSDTKIMPPSTGSTQVKVLLLERQYLRSFAHPSLVRAGLDGGRVAASLNLDVLFPVNGYKRYIAGGAYEFLYPKSWLEDVTLYRRRIERAEFQRGVEFKQLEDMERVAKGQSVVQPAVGFGPPAGTGEENLSVVAAPSPGLVCVASVT